MFFFKKKEVTLDFFINNEKFANLYAPKKASSHLPEWWKSLVPYYEEPNQITQRLRPSSTMKFCSGFKDLYASGFILPLWSDLIIDVNKENYFYIFADKSSSSQEHSAKQHGNSFNNFHHMKIGSPWYAVEKSGIKFAFIEPTWSWIRDRHSLRILPAVVSYDLQSATNINIFLEKKEEEYRIQIDAGDPIIHLIPLTDKKVNLKTHFVNQLEYDLIATRNPPTKFVGSFEVYKKFMRNQKVQR